MDKDVATGWIKKAIDTLFIFNPKATSMGILFGCIGFGLVSAFRPFFEQPNITRVFDISRFSWWLYLILGVFLFNLPHLFRQEPLPPSVLRAFQTIEEGKKKGNLTKPQVRLQYLSVISQVVAQVKLDEETQQKAKQLEKVLAPADSGKSRTKTSKAPKA